jgi:hypothetical protein
MQVVQTLLVQGNAQQVAWLNVDPRVKKGSVVTLKDEPESGQWEVAEQYMKQEASDIQRGWGNDLPKGQRTER